VNALRAILWRGLLDLLHSLRAAWLGHPNAPIASPVVPPLQHFFLILRVFARHELGQRLSEWTRRPASPLHPALSKVSIRTTL